MPALLLIFYWRLLLSINRTWNDFYWLVPSLSCSCQKHKNPHFYSLKCSLILKLFFIDYWVVLCIVACPIPGSGINTEPVPSSLNNSVIGTNYTYECLDCKYLPPADLFTECQSNGTWSLSPPTCELSMYFRWGWNGNK